MSPSPILNVAESSETATGPSISPVMVLVALRRWWKICFPIGLILGAAGGAVVFVNFVPMYQAQVWLRIHRNARYIAFQRQQESPDVFINNQMEAIRSPWVADAVLRRPEVALLPEISKAPEPREKLRQQLAIRAAGRSEFLTLDYRSTSPQNAATIVNAVADEYLAFYNSKGNEDDEELVKLLKERKEFHQKEVARLRENVRALAKIAAVKDPFAPDANTKQKPESPISQSLTELRKRLTDTMVEREVQLANIKVVEQQIARSEIKLPEEQLERALNEHPEIQEINEIIKKLTLKLAEIESTAAEGRRSPFYVKTVEEQRSLETKQDKLKTALRTEMRERLLREAGAHQQQILADMRTQLENQKTLQAALEERLKGEIADTQQLAGDTLELEFARSELDQRLDVFNRINTRIEQFETEREAPERVERLKAATPPSVPLETTPLKKMLMMAVALFGLPFGLAVAWELLARRINGRSELEKNTGLSVIGEIPDFTRISGRRRQKKQLEPYEESINSLRTHLMLSHGPQSHQYAQVLAVASAVSGEGKTSVAAKLAVSIARATRQPTLLIDADLRRPDIHQLFDLPLEPGLGDVLAAKCTWRDAIQTDAPSGLDVLCAGRMHLSPHRLFSVPAMHELLNELRGRYAHIVIDTPPVLQASESLVVLSSVDGCIMCAMRDYTRMERFQLAYRVLSSAGARPIGVVLNGVSWMQYASHYGDYRYYAQAAAEFPE